MEYIEFTSNGEMVTSFFRVNKASKSDEKQYQMKDCYKFTTIASSLAKLTIQLSLPLRQFCSQNGSAPTQQIPLRTDRSLTRCINIAILKR